ncbi:MAG: sterol desaturase family protein [Gemmatimonadota bacterium]|nr:sterol desaturase family protein [Gemmatimonadota bacterium]
MRHPAYLTVHGHPHLNAAALSMTESLFAYKPVLAAAALGAMWLLEGLIPMFEGRRERIRHDASNVALGIFNAVVASLIFAGATLVATEWARDNGFGLLHWLGVEGVWAFALGFVLFDMWQYFWHRLNHRIPFLWRFHAVHHADRELSASSGLRFHTGEIVLSSVARLAVLPLLGMTVGQVLLYEAVLLPIILFHHGNVGVPAGADRWLRWLIVTPWMHWVHHSDYQPETDSNYSSVFSFWDRIFGSFRLVADPRVLTLGLEDVERREWATLPGMAAMPFRRRRARRRGRRRANRAGTGVRSGDPGR